MNGIRSLFENTTKIILALIALPSIGAALIGRDVPKEDKNDTQLRKKRTAFPPLSLSQPLNFSHIPSSTKMPVGIQFVHNSCLEKCCIPYAYAEFQNPKNVWLAERSLADNTAPAARPACARFPDQKQSV
jgi:hypothetical protein